MATSYNGWPASPNPDAIGIDPGFEPIPGRRFPGGVKAGPVATVFGYLVRNLHARVERVDLYAPGDEWGYVYKASANSPSTLSCHSSGTAIDYNATRHPNGRRGTWTAAQVAEIRRIQSELGGVVRWLGDASGTPDEMHFEIRGSAADVSAVANRLTGNELTMADISTLLARLDRLEAAIGEVRNGVLVAIAEGRELDADLPENAEAELDELRIAARLLPLIVEELNRQRAAAGLPPLG